jgi:hypothetical protein
MRERKKTLRHDVTPSFSQRGKEKEEQERGAAFRRVEKGNRM